MSDAALAIVYVGLLGMAAICIAIRFACEDIVDAIRTHGKKDDE